MRALRGGGATFIVVCAVASYSGVAVAHGGSLAAGQADPLAIPTWLFLLTGGGIVGVSFLLASLATDRAFIEALHSWQRSVGILQRPFTWIGRVVGLIGLAVIVVSGYLGPQTPLQNMAILFIWVGWWAGYTMTVYLIGNSWPVLNPFRTLTHFHEDGYLEYPEWLGGWPSVAGLLAIIWLEVVSPLADSPRFLATVVVLYGLTTVVGASLVGPQQWFRYVDPVASVFRQYGRVAPLHRSGQGLVVTLPGSRLVAPIAASSDVFLIVAVVWGTTYDGFVQTPLWAAIATAVVPAGVPAPVLYPLALGLGYLLFAGVFLVAARTARSLAPTYLTTWTLARFFAPSLLAIAAGYHLAHYFSYFLELSPTLLTAALSPLQPAPPSLLVLPGWFGGLAIAFVLVGHLIAVWVAHSASYELFPSRLQAIRSQYPVTVVMVFYTMLSLWVVSQPAVSPPYL